MNMPPEGFCARLREARGKRTQAEAARLVGTCQQNWQRYEAGLNEPEFAILVDICAALGVSADWLLGISSDGGPKIGRSL